MKKKSAIQISIPAPCTQDWDAMQVQQGGRFCSHCQHEVVDFTKMSEEAVLTYLQQNKVVCAGFRRDQLDRPVTLVNVPKTGFWKRVVVSLFLLGAMQKAGAQKVQHLLLSNNITLSPLHQFNLLDRYQVTLKGTVRNEKGDPLINCSVVLTDEFNCRFRMATKTDFDGEYTFSIDTAEHVSDTLTLLASYEDKRLVRAIHIKKDVADQAARKPPIRNKQELLGKEDLISVGMINVQSTIGLDRLTYQPKKPPADMPQPVKRSTSFWRALKFWK